MLGHTNSLMLKKEKEAEKCPIEEIISNERVSMDEFIRLDSESDSSSKLKFPAPVKLKEEIPKIKLVSKIVKLVSIKIDCGGDSVFSTSPYSTVTDSCSKSWFLSKKMSDKSISVT